MIFNNKKDIISYVKTAPAVVETKRAYEGDTPGQSDFGEIEEELVGLIIAATDRPMYGKDWDAWLAVNVDELLREAVSIVM
jgi:hypothetical protein